MKKQFSITTMNVNFNNVGSKVTRKTKEILDTLVTNDPTFLVLQEFGTKSITGDVIGKELQDGLMLRGYSLIAPQFEAKYPVNVQLFYKRLEVKFISELSPIYENGYLNRQCGAKFVLDNTTLNIYSLYLPLYSNDEQGKQDYWEAILNFASKNNEENIILAGDFNESSLEPKPTMLAHNIEKLEKFYFDGSAQVETWKNKKLDHIFCSRPLLDNIVWIDEIVNTVSDHKGLYSKFEF